MKRDRTKGFITGMLVMALVFGLVGTAAATVGKRTAELEYDDIKIRVNGQNVVPTDANGNAVEPFAIGGTIYLPVRAVGNAMGYEVSWDAPTKTAVLLDDTYGVNLKLWASIYMDNATELKTIGDSVRWAQTLCQELLFVESAKGTLPNSDIKDMCSTHDANIQYLRDNIEYYEKRLPGLCDSKDTAEKMAKLYREIVAQLQKANDSTAGKGGKFTTYYSAALNKASELIELCDDEYLAIVKKAQDSMEKMEISLDDATAKPQENTPKSNTADKGTNENPSTGDTSTPSVDAQYLADRAALDSAYQSERAGLVSALDAAQQERNMAGAGLPDGDTKEMEIRMAQFNLEAAEKALSACDSKYESDLAALDSKYGV